MGFVMRNESFVCEHCGKTVPPHPEGSARNHCPFCLHSKHLDDEFPGDRASECGGLMEPVDIDFRKKNGWVIVHKCKKCGKTIVNKLAPDDEYLEFMKELAGKK